MRVFSSLWIQPENRLDHDQNIDFWESRSDVWLYRINRILATAFLNHLLVVALPEWINDGG